jgi:hypothetical protein
MQPGGPPRGLSLGLRLRLVREGAIRIFSLDAAAACCKFSPPEALILSGIENRGSRSSSLSAPSMVTPRRIGNATSPRT